MFQFRAIAMVFVSLLLIMDLGYLSKISRRYLNASIAQILQDLILTLMELGWAYRLQRPSLKPTAAMPRPDQEKVKRDSLYRFHTDRSQTYVALDGMVGVHVIAMRPSFGWRENA